MDNEKNLKDEFKKADIESINLLHHMKIRTATINDLDAIAAVEADCFLSLIHISEPTRP